MRTPLFDLLFQALSRFVPAGCSCVLSTYGGDLVLDIVVPPLFFIFVFMKLSSSRTAATRHESFAPGIPTPLRSLGAMLLHGD